MGTSFPFQSTRSGIRARVNLLLGEPEYSTAMIVVFLNHSADSITISVLSCSEGNNQNTHFKQLWR